jgi:Lrp/AsnC family transcriptional regulator, leucine-responsive regulatory protein
MNIKEMIGDHKNIEILRLLQRNPRMSIAELARKIRMSNPATKERVRRLENSGVIAGYRLELDPKAAGHEITAFVRIRPLPGHLPKISVLAQRIPEVVECHRMTGEDCFILKVHLPEIASLDRVLDRFLVHGQTTTSIVQSSPVPPRPPPLSAPPARVRAKRV